MREDTRDVLVGRRLDDLSDGARVGTELRDVPCKSSTGPPGHELRLDVVPIRGNVETRIERAREGKVDAVILARPGCAGSACYPRWMRSPTTSPSSSSQHRFLIIR